MQVKQARRWEGVLASKMGRVKVNQGEVRSKCLRIKPVGIKDEEDAKVSKGTHTEIPAA